MVNDQHVTPCPSDTNTIHVRDGTTVKSQTYWLNCGGERGIGLFFYQAKDDCLEFTEIEVWEQEY